MYTEPLLVHRYALDVLAHNGDGLPIVWYWLQLDILASQFPWLKLNIFKRIKFDHLMSIKAAKTDLWNVAANQPLIANNMLLRLILNIHIHIYSAFIFLL